MVSLIILSDINYHFVFKIIPDLHTDVNPDHEGFILQLQSNWVYNCSCNSALMKIRNNNNYNCSSA